MKLIEVFNTYQGEGPDSGRQMTLIRFRKCDRVENKCACSWCDTLVKMRISAEADYDIDTISEMVRKTGGLMITGGEPGYGNNISDTRTLLQMKGYDIANIETNGCNITNLCNFISDENLHEKVKIIYSPKFFNPEETDIAIAKTKMVVGFPFVYIKVVDDKSVYVKDYLYEVTKMKVRKDQIWVMPEGDSLETSLENSKETFDLIEKYGVNFSSRNHIIFGFI
jgi:organic radical activating enzyme